MATFSLLRACQSFRELHRVRPSPFCHNLRLCIRSSATLTSLPWKKHSLQYNKDVSSFHWCLSFNVGRRHIFRMLKKIESVDSAAWACRLANENGYLSWCRNSYLLTAAGVAMLYHCQTEKALLCGYDQSVSGTTKAKIMSQMVPPYDKLLQNHILQRKPKLQRDLEGCAIFLAGVSLSWGTLMFIYNLLCLRRRVNMSIWFVMLQSVAAIFHCVFYLAVIVVFSEESDRVLGENIEIETEEL